MTRELTDDWGMLRGIGYAQELTNLATGSDKAIFPAAWNTSVQIPFRGIAMFALATPAAGSHAFTFTLQSAGTTIGTVTITTTGHYWETNANFSLRGLTDYVSVAHDSHSHTEEGSRLWAILLPA